MLILFGTPILAAFPNYFIPLLLGADDMAFPRVNAIALWLHSPSALLVYAGFLIPTFPAAQTSWTMYTPLSIPAAESGCRSHASRTPPLRS